MRWLTRALCAAGIIAIVASIAFAFSGSPQFDPDDACVGNAKLLEQAVGSYIQDHNEQFPPNGVYAVEASLDGARLGGVANIGVRPTIRNASGERIFEVHLFDFHREIYGMDLEIRFRGFLRGEQKFGDLDELRAQIAKDAAAARARI